MGVFNMGSIRNGAGGRRWLWLAALLGAALPLRADQQDVGTTAVNFLKIPPPARAAAMGQAFTALSDDDSALYYNPAGAASVFQNEVALTHVEWFQNIFLEQLGTILDYGRYGNLGVGVDWLDAGDIERTDRSDPGNSDPLQRYVDLGSFQPYDLALTGLYAFQPFDNWNAGVSVNLLNQVIDSNQGWGVNLNLGAQRTGLWNCVDAGFEVQNLGTQLSVGSTPFSQPLSFRAGAAGHYLDRKLTLSVDLNLPSDNATEPSVGGEYWIADILAIRAGWRGGYASNMSLGLGFKIGLFNLDYAWQPYNELGATQRLGASVSWGTPDAAIEALKPLLGPMGEAEWRQGGFRLLPARPDTVKHWTVTVLGPDNSPAKTLQGDGPAPDTVDWAGKDDKEQVLPDQVYHARLDVLYNNGLRATATGGPVELDSTPPDVSCTLSPIIARPNAEGAVLVPAHLAIYATDKHGVGAWKMEIRDPQGNLFKAFSGDGQPPQDLVWDGTDDQGHFVQTGSHYVFWPFAKDKLGNWGKGRPTAMLVLLKEIHFDIASDALFEPGKADVRISAYHQLSGVKDLIDKYASPGSLVDIVGHTDNVPTVHSVYKSNQELSLARAKAVIRYLVDLLDMDPQMLNPVGVGDTQPKASDATPDGRTANRRVEVIVHAKEYK